MRKIEFFKDNKSLGSFDCPELSDHDTRDMIAKQNNITAYDKVILDDGRLVISKTPFLQSDYTIDGTKWYFINTVKV